MSKTWRFLPQHTTHTEPLCIQTKHQKLLQQDSREYLKSFQRLFLWAGRFLDSDALYVKLNKRMAHSLDVGSPMITFPTILFSPSTFPFSFKQKESKRLINPQKPTHSRAGEMDLKLVWMLTWATAIALLTASSLSLTQDGQNPETHHLFFSFSLSFSGFQSSDIFSLFFAGETLLDMKEAFNDTRNVLRSWNGSDATPCNWTGISCYLHDHRVRSMYGTNSILLYFLLGCVCMEHFLREREVGFKKE